MITSLLVLLLSCLMMTVKELFCESLSDSPAPFSSVEADVVPTLDKLEKPVCVVIYPEQNYGGDPMCLRAGQYLDPLQIEQIIKLKSLRVPKGVLFQLSGDNAVSTSVNSEASIPVWTPPTWPVLEILVIKSELIGQKSYEDLPGPVERVSEEISPGPDNVLTRLSDPLWENVFVLFEKV